MSAFTMYNIATAYLITILVFWRALFIKHHTLYVTGFGKMCIVHTSDITHSKIHKIW